MPAATRRCCEGRQRHGDGEVKTSVPSERLLTPTVSEVKFFFSFFEFYTLFSTRLPVVRSDFTVAPRARREKTTEEEKEAEEEKEEEEAERPW